MHSPNHQQKCKVVQRHNQHILHLGLLLHDNKPQKHMYIEGPPPLYISYVSPEQTKQDRHQDTLEPGDKGQ